MIHLKLRLISKADWSKYLDAPAGSTVFCPNPAPPSIGSKVQLEVLFQGGPRLLMHGRVLWRRTGNDPRARAGAGIGVDPSDKQKLEFVEDYVTGRVRDQRSKRRLPIRLRVTYRTHTGRRINFTRDIHEDGVFVRSTELLAPGDETRLIIAPPGGDYKPIEVRGAVVRLVEEEPDRGMGIQLVFKDDEERQSFADFVSRMEEEYLVGTLPDEALS